MCTEACLSRQRGITLVEQIVFIVVVSVGVIGVLSTLGSSIKFSAEPQVRKQQLAIAESLLSEILHQPFTYCDPDDAKASTATLIGGSPDCADPANVQNNAIAALRAVPNTEARGGNGIGSSFDNVADYAGFSATTVTDITGAGPMNGFAVSVAIRPIGGNYTYSGTALPNGDALEIAVTVTGGGGDPLTLTGYRFRYAPRY